MWDHLTAAALAELQVERAAKLAAFPDAQKERLPRHNGDLVPGAGMEKTHKISGTLSLSWADGIRKTFEFSIRVGVWALLGNGGMAFEKNRYDLALIDSDVGKTKFVAVNEPVAPGTHSYFLFAVTSDQSGVWSVRFRVKDTDGHTLHEELASIALFVPKSGSWQEQRLSRTLEVFEHVVDKEDATLEEIVESYYPRSDLSPWFTNVAIEMARELNDQRYRFDKGARIYIPITVRFADPAYHAHAIKCVLLPKSNAAQIQQELRNIGASDLDLARKLAEQLNGRRIRIRDETPVWLPVRGAATVRPRPRIFEPR